MERTGATNRKDIFENINDNLLTLFITDLKLIFLHFNISNYIIPVPFLSNFLTKFEKNFVINIFKSYKVILRIFVALSE